MNPRPAWWLRGAHFQTIWSRMVRSRRLVTFQREGLVTPDGDELLLDHLPGASGAPRVLLLHGLEGSAHSFHTQGLAHLIRTWGWSTTVLNFRSCARDPSDLRRRMPNRRPRLYHSGETADVDLVVRTLAARAPRVPLYAIGFSLGGNVLLKWLGENGEGSAISRAVAISVPYDLRAAAIFLERPWGRFYMRHFMARLKNKALALMAQFPAETSHLDRDRISRARTFREFDDCVTAPLHGFAGADDYYGRSSSLAFLPRIGVPTLCISGADDPFFPAHALIPARSAASPQVTFTVMGWGGHTGFVTGLWPWRPVYWAEETALNFLAAKFEGFRSAPRPPAHASGVRQDIKGEV